MFVFALQHLQLLVQEYEINTNMFFQSRNSNFSALKLLNAKHKITSETSLDHTISTKRKTKGKKLTMLKVRKIKHITFYVLD